MDSLRKTSGSIINLFQSIMSCYYIVNTSGSGVGDSALVELAVAWFALATCLVLAVAQPRRLLVGTEGGCPSAPAGTLPPPEGPARL